MRALVEKFLVAYPTILVVLYATQPFLEGLSLPVKAFVICGLMVILLEFVMKNLVKVIISR